MVLLTIIGTRPQFIKSALLSKELEKNGIPEIIIHTGQHYDQNMSDIFFQELNLKKPKYHLHHGRKSHAQMTGELMIELEKIMITESSLVSIKAVMVYGDCDTTLAGALVAAKLHIPVIHIESGLRSFDKRMPEEINRVLTDKLSDLLLCPTDTAIENLNHENQEQNVFLTGDLMIELLRKLIPKIRKNDICKRLNLPTLYFVATIHREENTTMQRLEEIISRFNKLSYPVVIPLHPRTKKMINNQDSKIDMKNIAVIEPVGYLDMMSLVDRSVAVLTDSGGLQKEAYELRKPCYTIRPNTEWRELITIGWNKLVYDQFPQDILQDIEQIKKKDHPLLYRENAASEMVRQIKNITISF